MFAFLRGTVAAKTVNQVHLDVHGVGYEVWVPDSVHRKVRPDQEVTLLTYCHIREDMFLIFGFLREEEKALFKTLLSLTGVGPKVALSILSTLPPAEFGRAILDNDVTALTRVGGVGKKGAQRIIVEMKAKLGQDTELSALLGESDNPGGEPEGDDVIAALCSMGCTMGEAKRAAAKARKELGNDAAVEDVLKAALRSMARI